MYGDECLTHTHTVGLLKKIKAGLPHLVVHARVVIADQKHDNFEKVCKII